jgi:RHS repeat-associated protein
VAQKFKYNGIELEESLGLNLYEMDVRTYDPAIARFNGIDPVTHHSQGTSVAFDNNPVFWADPSGADSVERVMGGTKFTGEAAIHVFNQLKDRYGGEDEENDGSRDNGTNHSSDDGDDPIDKKKYKGKVQTAPGTPIWDINGNINVNAYNCHSFAWCNSKGDPTDPANVEPVRAGVTKWDNDPTNNTVGYKPLDFNDPNQVGDRLIYYAWDSRSRSIRATHSAIVTKVDSNGKTIEVESKWGDTPRYKHHPRDIPASYGATTEFSVTPDGQKFASRIYFRKKP